MEILDLYTKDRVHSGKTMVRGQDELPEDHFVLIVHVWIFNEDGQMLLQKRAKHLKHYPGKWSIVSGAVSAGENSRQGAVREMEEEMGIQLIAQDELFVICDDYLGTTSHLDIYGLSLKQAYDTELFTGTEEVDKACWATKKDFDQLTIDEEAGYFSDKYLKIVFEHKRVQQLLASNV